MLLTLLAVVTVAVMRQRSLFGVVVLMSHLQLPDGQRIDCARRGGCRHDGSLGRSRDLHGNPAHNPASDQNHRDAVDPAPSILPLFVAIGTGGVLVWGTLVLPPFGTADAVIHKHVAPRYIADTIKETNVPNAVTSVLADYRGYDTLGETTVIFTAGIGVMLLLRGARRRRGAAAAKRRSK